MMSEKKFTLKEMVELVLFSLLWLFFGYWLITQFFTFSDSWIPVLFLLLPYLIIVSKVWKVSIKASPTGVEVVPIADKVTKAETFRTIATELRSRVPSEREELIELITKGEIEQIPDENWREIKGIAKYVAIYAHSPLSRVLAISDATNYEYFPVIDDDKRRELRGVVTRPQILGYRTGAPADWEHIRISEILMEKKPPIRAYINEPSKEVLKRMLRNNLTRLPVVNARNQLKGVIALKDLSEI